jgi:hypothetical protein
VCFVSGSAARQYHSIALSHTCIPFTFSFILFTCMILHRSFSQSLRKSSKWYKKFFFHLLDISLYNACVLYKLQTGEKIALFDFRLNVVLALVEEFDAQKSDSLGRRSIETPVRITARHFPSKVESSNDGEDVEIIS